MIHFLLLLLIVIWFGFGGIPSASAHGLEAGQMSVLIDTVNAGVIAAPYASAFPFADENSDGLLSAEEVDVHEDAIYALIKERVVLRNEEGPGSDRSAIDVAAPDDGTANGDQAAADFVQISMRAAWPTVPEVVDVEYTLFGSADESIHFLMLDNDSDTKEVIEGKFSSAETIIRLRGEGTPTQTGSAIWLSGIDHVCRATTTSSLSSPSSWLPLVSANYSFP